ncbi:hypothetical protein ACOIOT_003424 [Cronobacter turicensis]
MLVLLIYLKPNREQYRYNICYQPSDVVVAITGGDKNKINDAVEQYRSEQPSGEPIHALSLLSYACANETIDFNLDQLLKALGRSLTALLAVTILLSFHLI